MSRRHFATDRPRRPLSIVRHRAPNGGASPSTVDATIDAIADIPGEADVRTVRLLRDRVLGK